jgi:hypothetical protein
MDEALNVASIVTGAFSLTIQLVQLTQKHTSRMINLPLSVRSYLADLISLKDLLSTIQNALALPSPTSGISTGLAADLSLVTAELEILHNKLHDAQYQKASFLIKTLIWPFPDDETIRWADSLRRCRERIEATVMVNGL